MKLITFNKLPGLVIVILLLGGCALIAPNGEYPERPGQELMDELERAYRQGNSRAIANLIHPDAEIPVADLRADQREVFRRRHGIRLDIHSRIYRYDEGQDYARVETNWNLSWRKENVEVEKRRGETDFELRLYNNQWLIYNQSRDSLLGDLEPGRTE